MVYYLNGLMIRWFLPVPFILSIPVSSFLFTGSVFSFFIVSNKWFNSSIASLFFILGCRDTLRFWAGTEAHRENSSNGIHNIRDVLFMSYILNEWDVFWVKLFNDYWQESGVIASSLSKMSISGLRVTSRNRRSTGHSAQLFPCPVLTGKGAPFNIGWFPNCFKKYATLASWH